MSRVSAPPRSRAAAIALAVAALATLGAAAVPGAAHAQDEGGLYIAGAGFTFRQAAERAMAQNPGGRTFFVLALPPETVAITVAASPALTALRERVRAANGVLMVCQRDVDQGRVDGARLATGVVAVRGWPAAGGPAAGQRYLPGENPAEMPASDEALRRLRSVCSG
jgi:hypothetical protein